MGTTIFYGNGINLLGNGESWDSVLMQLSEGKILPPIGSNTLKYEYVVLNKEKYITRPFGYEHGFTITEDNVLLLESVNTEYDIIKKGIADRLLKNKVSDFPFYAKLAELQADNYITTNYESFIKDLLVEKGYNVQEPINPCLKERPHYTLSNGSRNIRLWNIHGSIDYHESIMLGLYEYCDYVKGFNKLFKEDYSWLNVMLNTDVFILGFGLAYEEIDLWYFLVSRKRLIRDKKIPANKIVFYVLEDKGYDIGKMKMLEALDVEVDLIPFDWSEDAYKKAYDMIYDKILIQQNNLD